MNARQTAEQLGEGLHAMERSQALVRLLGEGATPVAKDGTPWTETQTRAAARAHLDAVIAIATKAKESLW